jgi:hypothetical protein
MHDKESQALELGGAQERRRHWACHEPPRRTQRLGRQALAAAAGWSRDGDACVHAAEASLLALAVGANSRPVEAGSRRHQLKRARPHETPRVTRTASVRWPAMRGFVEAGLPWSLDGIQGTRVSNPFNSRAWSRQPTKNYGYLRLLGQGGGCLWLPGEPADGRRKASWGPPG